jgi:DNA-binding HxlR family transcriptional regulator
MKKIRDEQKKIQHACFDGGMGLAEAMQAHEALSHQKRLPRNGLSDAAKQLLGNDYRPAIINALKNTQMPLSDICKATGRTKGTITNQLNNMKKDGIVACEFEPGHGRRRRKIWRLI